MKYLLFIGSLLFINDTKEFKITDTISTKDGGRVFLGNTECISGKDCDIVLRKENDQKEFEWEYKYGGTSYDISNAILETENGSLVFVGSTSSFGAGNYDVYVVKTDRDGKEIWSKTFGGFYNEYGYTIAETLDNGFIIESTKQNCFGDKNDFSQCVDVSWILKINSSGDLEWERASELRVKR